MREDVVVVYDLKVVVVETMGVQYEDPSSLSGQAIWQL